MDYNVALTFGAEGTSTQLVSNVSDIQFFNESYYFQNETGDVLFIAPLKSVVFIKKK